MTAEGPPRILLVEDNPDDVEFARMALAKAGAPFRLEVAMDGPTAIAALCGAGGQGPAGPLPGLVLLDIKLPLLDGKEVLRRMRASPATRAIPVVVLTSSEEPSDVRECYELGADSYFVKPIDFREFASGASVLVHFWLRLHAAGRTFPPAPTAVTTLALGQSTRRPNGGIVIVDGDERDRRTTADALAGETVGGIRAYGGIEAAWPDLRARFARLLLMERRFCDGTARDLIARVRAELDARVSIVVFTRAASPEDVASLLAMDANGVVRKPEALEEFRAVAAIIARYWLRLNRLPSDRL